MCILALGLNAFLLLSYNFSLLLLSVFFLYDKVIATVYISTCLTYPLTICDTKLTLLGSESIARKL